MFEYKITKKGNKLHIDEFPDGVKVISLKNVSGINTQVLEDLWLHRYDLRHAKECLEKINEVSHEEKIVRESLWRTAIILYFKCFQWSKAREKLLFEKIYSGEKLAEIAFKNMSAIRDKHFVHDENFYTRTFPGAILNNGKKKSKVEHISCFATFVQTLNQENWNNLFILVNKAIQFVEVVFDKECDSIKEKLEKMPYNELLSFKDLTLVIQKKIAPDISRR